MKKLIVPAFGLFLAACTYQFVPAGSETTKRPDFNAPAPSTATAAIDVPAAPETSGPGGPGGAASPGAPDGDGSDGTMPELPAGGSMPGG